MTNACLQRLPIDYEVKDRHGDCHHANPKMDISPPLFGQPQQQRDATGSRPVGRKPQQDSSGRSKAPQHQERNGHPRSHISFLGMDRCFTISHLTCMQLRLKKDQLFDDPLTSFAFVFSRAR